MNRRYRLVFNAVILFLVFTVSVFSQGKITIAVLDFEAKNITQQSAEAVTDILRTELFNTGAFRVVERQRIQRILEEQKFQMSGLTDPDQAAEIGRLLNVEKIMVGSVTRLGSTFIINTRIVEVQTGLVELAEAAECRGGEEQLPRAITELALKIFYKVGLEGAIIRVDGEEIYIDLGNADGVKLGQYLDVIRKGDVITDLEGRIIGTRQETIGHALITKVQDRFSVAAVHTRKEAFRKGDLVRPSESDPPPKPVERPARRTEEPAPKPAEKDTETKKVDVPILF
ncbi:MAG TPA: hypothetical protein ENN17_10330 [bacterium]|nr:hypothetical protein [bacterium]